MFRDRFSPRSYARYGRSIPGELAQAIRSRFVLSDDLRFSPALNTVSLVGTIVCEGGIRIEVEERLRYVRMGWLGPVDAVQLEYYRYNAVLADRGTIFRYNSPHQDHREFHHVHRFDVLGSGKETVVPLKEREVPSLRELLTEAEDWYLKNLTGGRRT